MENHGIMSTTLPFFPVAALCDVNAWSTARPVDLHDALTTEDGAQATAMAEIPCRALSAIVPA